MEKNHRTQNIGTITNSRLQSSTGNSYYPQILINSLFHCPPQLFYNFTIFLKFATCACHLPLSFCRGQLESFFIGKWKPHISTVFLNRFPPSDFNLYPSFSASCISLVLVTSHLFQKLLHQFIIPCIFNLSSLLQHVNIFKFLFTENHIHPVISTAGFLCILFKQSTLLTPLKLP